jgi:hypothetical protein
MGNTPFNGKASPRSRIEKPPRIENASTENVVNRIKKLLAKPNWVQTAATINPKTMPTSNRLVRCVEFKPLSMGRVPASKDAELKLAGDKSWQIKLFDSADILRI